MGTPFRRLDNYPLRAHTYFYAASLMRGVFSRAGVTQW